MAPQAKKNAGGKKAQKKEKMTAYQYVECGLDNVVLKDVVVRELEDGDEMVLLPAINELHRLIATDLLRLERSLSGKEIRFLRSEMGMTQEELADLLKVSRKTINSWENEKHQVEANAEFVLRKLAAERLKIEIDASNEQMIKWCRGKAESSQITIDSTKLKAA